MKPSEKRILFFGALAAAAVLIVRSLGAKKPAVAQPANNGAPAPTQTQSGGAPTSTGTTPDDTGGSTGLSDPAAGAPAVADPSSTPPVYTDTDGTQINSTLEGDGNYYVEDQAGNVWEYDPSTGGWDPVNDDYSGQEVSADASGSTLDYSAGQDGS